MKKRLIIALVTINVMTLVIGFYSIYMGNSGAATVLRLIDIGSSQWEKTNDEKLHMKYSGDLTGINVEQYDTSDTLIEEFKIQTDMPFLFPYLIVINCVLLFLVLTEYKSEKRVQKLE